MIEYKEISSDNAQDFEIKLLDVVKNNGVVINQTTIPEKNIFTATVVYKVKGNQSLTIERCTLHNGTTKPLNHYKSE